MTKYFTSFFMMLVLCTFLSEVKADEVPVSFTEAVQEQPIMHVDRFFYGKNVLQKEIGYIDSQSPIYIKDYYKDGKIKNEFDFKTNHPHIIAKMYYPNGNLKEVSILITSPSGAFIEDGVSTKFDLKGNVQSKQNFKEGKPVDLPVTP